jgi:hypothetical protein
MQWYCIMIQAIVPRCVTSVLNPKRSKQKSRKAVQQVCRRIATADKVRVDTLKPESRIHAASFCTAKFQQPFYHLFDRGSTKNPTPPRHLQ